MTTYGIFMGHFMAYLFMSMAYFVFQAWTIRIHAYAMALICVAYGTYFVAHEPVSAAY